MNVLVTGAAGYIATHTIIELLAAGHRVVGLDNFVNSSPVALERVRQITGKATTFRQVDVRNAAALHDLLQQYPVDACIHFAGLKAVGESVEQPLSYYDNNVHGTQVLLSALEEAGVRVFVFSSTAMVYGNPTQVPISEDSPTDPTNPYGRSKLMVEHILADLVVANTAWRVGVLRYFNSVGAHESGLIGEDPRGIPNNLMPFIAQVAVGRRPYLSVFGNDWPTVDGTGVRDYIHVTDLARGHVAALHRLSDSEDSFTLNLGTGQGTSVLQMVHAFQEASGRPIPYRFAPRRPGDIAVYNADPALAHRLLGWQAQLGLRKMCESTWRWQQQNPDGYLPRVFAD